LLHFSPSQASQAGMQQKWSDPICCAVDEFLREDTFLQGIVCRDPDILTPEVLRVALDFEHSMN